MRPRNVSKPLFTDSATTSTQSVAVPAPRQPVHDGIIDAVIVAPYPAPALPPPPRRSFLWPILTALLVYEQSLVSEQDVSQVKRAFDLNGYVGILYFATTALAIYAR